MIRCGFTKTELVVVLAILGGLMFCCAPFGFWPAELVVCLAIGWIPFLGRVGPQIEPDWGTITLGCIALAVFTVGLHFFLRWFYAAVPAKTAAESPAPQPATWRLRWTVSAVAIIVMLFVAGISMVGITHQLAWMATAKEPLIGSSSVAGRRIQSANNVKQLVLGMLDYHDIEMTLPPAAIVSPTGEAQHGWQTIILPYVEQKPLYDKIDFSKPWHDKSQEGVFMTQVKSFLMIRHPSPAKDAAGYALSHYAANQHALSGTRPRGLAEFSDGTANTILAGEAAGNYKPWGHPRNWRDPTLGINATPDGFGSPWPGGANVALADGSIRFLSDKIAPEVLRALATPAGGEPILADEARP